MAFPEKNYTLGTGKLFFDQFVPDTQTKTGQRYLGNTPEFNTTAESEVLDHFDSDEGIRQKDDSVVLELNRTGGFITDHISPENLALFFLGAASVQAQVSDTGLSETITDAKLERRYQIGSTVSNPAGARGITNVVVKVGVTTYVVDVDYTVNLATGGLVILESGSIADLADVIVEYDEAATSWNHVVTSDNAAIYGALYFEATNPKGQKFDYYWPSTVVRPDGDFNLKSGDEWQQLGFSVEFLKLNSNTQVCYINGRPGAAL